MESGRGVAAGRRCRPGVAGAVSSDATEARQPVTTVAHTDHGASHGGAGWVSAAPLLVLIGLLVLGYLLAAAYAPCRWNQWRTAAWIAGCAVLAVAVSPLPGGYGDPRTHMAQHLLLGMLAPLGLVLAAPVTLLLRVATPRSRHAVARVLRSRPVHLIGHPV